MIALFDCHSHLVGWLRESDEKIFDTQMHWVAFVHNGYIFSSHCHWLGGYKNETIIDQDGKAVAWIRGHSPRSTAHLSHPATPAIPATPATPARPATPATPTIPATPAGGWSHLDWLSFLKQ